MPFQHVDMSSAMRRLADRRIEEAMQAGKFDNLEGMGQPLDLEPMPAEENARMTWWAIRLLRKNEFIPHEVQWRKQIELLKETLRKARDESAVRKIVSAINDLVHKLNTLGTGALKGDVAPLDLQTELHTFRSRGLVKS